VETSTLTKENAPETETLYEGKFLRFLRKGEWEYAQRNNCSDIVIIVAVTQDRHILFVEQFRPPVGQRVIEFPAGLVNDQNGAVYESVTDAAKRELLEETGYKAEVMTVLLNGPVSGGSSADMVTMVLAREVVKISDGGGVEDETIVVHRVALDEADAWLDSMRRSGDCLIEPKIYTGLYFLTRYNNYFLESGS